jgi:hypothetical protein
MLWLVVARAACAAYNPVLPMARRLPDIIFFSL